MRSPLCALCVSAVGLFSAISASLCALGCGTYSPLDSHYNRGVEFYDQGRLPDAIREYRMALEDDPSSVRSRFNLAVCFHDLGKLEEAVAEYDRVLAAQPDNARAMVNKASILNDRGRDDEARGLLERAARADPDSGFPRSSLGAFYERHGDADRALAEYRASVAVEPRHAPGHYHIGVLLARRGDLDGAIAAFDAALGADPDDVATLIASSEARERKDDVKTATLHLERALVRARDRADLWGRLAGLYESLGRLEEAVAALWEARGLSPGDASIGPRLKSLYTRLAARERP